jgi:hypothetical protein
MIQSDNNNQSSSVIADRANLPNASCQEQELYKILHLRQSKASSIDIVDYYLSAILPSPETDRIDMSSISLPTLAKLGLLPKVVE